MASPFANLAPLAAANPGLTEVIAPHMGAFFAAFLAALVLTPMMRALAVRHGIIDRPDHERKHHALPAAYLGGVAILLGWLIGVAAAQFTQTPAPHVPPGILLGATVIMFTGLIDDVYGISPPVKIAGQLFAAAALALEDVGLQLVEASLTLMGLPAPDLVVLALGTVVLAAFVVGGCNAFNLVDGLDGLAAGVTAIGCLGLLVIAGLVAGGSAGESHAASDAVRIVMCLAILGAVLGFLPYNFNPATIFMGDAGSLLLGFLVVAAVLLFADVAGGGPRLVTAALIIFALPITETALTIFRRTMRGQHLLEPDTEHLHHMLRRAGLSVRQAVATLYAAAITLAALGCTLVALELRWRYVLGVFVVLFGFVLASGYKYGQHLRLHTAAAGEGDAEGPGETERSAGPAETGEAGEAGGTGGTGA